MSIILHNSDCLPAMREMPDNAFDLAIVDPPYGINAPRMSMGQNLKRDGKNRQPSTAQKLKTPSFAGRGKLKNRALNSMDTTWDCFPPTQEYFDELFRVSKNQIIWGGNYFNLPPTRGIICWDKCQSWESFSQVELAWTSFNRPAALFKYSTTGGGKRGRKDTPNSKTYSLV